MKTRERNVPLSSLAKLNRIIVQLDRVLREPDYYLTDENIRQVYVAKQNLLGVTDSMRAAIDRVIYRDFDRLLCDTPRRIVDRILHRLYSTNYDEFFAKGTIDAIEVLEEIDSRMRVEEKSL
jgi:hypothetical protein